MLFRSASSSGVALGISPLADLVSAKMGYSSKGQSGQMAGAAEFLFAHNMPAIKVPWVQAMLSDRVQAMPDFPEISWIFSAARSEWSVAIGPSIKPMGISLLPAVRFINAVSLIWSR